MRTYAGYPTYDDYLRSRHWRQFRARYQQERRWRCVICEATTGLELHHKRYDTLGRESFDDVCPLCSDCHPLLHQLHREGQGGLDPSALFVPALGRQRRALAAKRAQAMHTPRERRRAYEERERATRMGRSEAERRLLNQLARLLMQQRGQKGSPAKQSAKTALLERAKLIRERGASSL
jgi:hypothetical protein